jgi:hypothetical protein
LVYLFPTHPPATSRPFSKGFEGRGVPTGAFLGLGNRWGASTAKALPSFRGAQGLAANFILVYEGT